MAGQNGISVKSGRVAKNTLLLYFRMFLLMLVGLLTSRVVLHSLGVDDYGTYQVVYSAVMMFTVLSNGISGSISRYLAFEIGKGSPENLRKVFSSAIAIQVGLCIVLFILAESVGLWYVRNKINIPEGRGDAAMWVFQTSVLYLAVQLMSIPFNCAIVAHEDMKAFAWVSILEGLLKLGIALALYLTTSDKLKVYSVLMLAVAFAIRGIYASFCKRHYEETRGKPEPDRKTVRQLLSLGAWSFIAHGVGVFNTQGVNLLSNSFFGVTINAVRGIAGQVENIVRQFASNFLTALNPLIIKTWAEGDKEYCFELVRKGCKFCFLIVLLFAVPFLFESDFILRVWLGDFPDKAPLFASLAIICVMMDFMSNSLAQLMLANGRVGWFYSVTSAISSLTFIGTFIAFSCGAAPQAAYYITASVFLAVAVTRLIFTKAQCGFSVKPFIKEVVIPLSSATALSVFLIWISSLLISFDTNLMHCVRILSAMALVCIASYFLVLTGGERAYCRTVVRKLFGKDR